MSIAMLSAAPLASAHRQAWAPCACISLRNAARPGTAPKAHVPPRAWRHLVHRSLLPALAAAAVEEAPAAAEEDDVSVDELKAQLLDSLFGTERGLAASSEVRAEINELITQLEGCNPTPSLDQAASQLDGRWKLVYASNSGVLGLLGLARLPGVTVGDITQSIESASMSVQNKVELSGPFSRTALTTSASYELRSPKRLQVRFERGTVATPELLQDVDLPSSVSVLGQPVDLTPVKEALAPVGAAARDAVGQLQRLLGRQPDLSFPITATKAQTWLINTFLDEDMRVTRGDGGAIFVLVKEAPAQLGGYSSPPPPPPPPADDGGDDGGAPAPEAALPAAPPAPPPPTSAPAAGPRVDGPVSAAEGQGFDRTAGPVAGEFTVRGAAEGQGFDPDTAAAEGQGF